MKGARFLLLFLCSAPLGWGAVDDVGVLLRPVGDDTNAWLAEHVLGAAAREERLGADDPFHQHQAVRRLRSSGCCGGAMLMSSAGCPQLQQQQAPLVLCPSLLRPDTTRAALDLIRDLGWRDLIYISNQPQQGLERLQMMFRVGYGALRLRVLGLTSQGLRSGGRRRVLLDLPPPLAADLLIRRAHVTPADDNHYLLMQPTLPDFWLLPELRVLKVFGFTFSSESRHQMEPPPFPHPNLTVENYYFHDAALFARKAMELRPLMSIKDILQKVVVSEGGLSGGGVRFSAQGTRADVNLTVMYTTADNGVQKYGWWSDAGKVGGLRRSYPPPPRQGALSQVQEKMIFRITSRLRAPFLVRNATGGLEGFCADLAYALCDALDARCELGLAADGLPGDFDGATWSGMVGEIVTGRADLALGDLVVTGARQRAVEFLEPFLEGHLSLLLARPSPSSSLAPSAWGCAALAAALVAVALLVLGGPPDTIEAASALWRNKLSPSTAAWLVLGSATLQPTGVYPRSLASRVLVVSWWLFTGFFACMLLASLAAQLRLRAADKSPQMEQLKALSFQAILKEAVENGWPEIGVLSHSYTEKSIQASGVPLLREVARVARRVSSLEEGEALLLGGGGGFALLTESAYGDPCHTVAVHSPSPHASFAPALSPRLQPQLRAMVSSAYELLSTSGGIGHLHRKWWGNQCDHVEDTVSGGQVTSAWRPLALLFGALVVLVLVFAAQYALKVRSKHSRRQQLTFEDIHFDQRLPTPPPELLPPPPPTHEVPEIHQGSVNGAESFQDFFERMRTGSS